MIMTEIKKITTSKLLLVQDFPKYILIKTVKTVGRSKEKNTTLVTPADSTCQSQETIRSVNKN